jgi:hypothetical protein
MKADEVRKRPNDAIQTWRYLSQNNERKGTFQFQVNLLRVKMWHRKANRKSHSTLHRIQLYLYVGYLTMLSVAWDGKTIDKGWIERIWKEVVVA